MNEEALAQLQTSAAAFVELIGQPSSEARKGDWGPREVLAHFVFAFELYASYLAAAAGGAKPPWFRGTVVEQNARAVAKCAGVPVADMVRRFESAVRTFVELASRPEVNAMQFRTRAGSAPKELSKAIRMIDGHVRGHTRDLKRVAR